jgi:carbamoyltransferase
MVSSMPAFVHDHNITLMSDGKVEQYLHLERYTRLKHDNRLDEFIENLIENKTFDLPEDFQVVFANSFEANSFISKTGRIKFESRKLFPNPPQLVDGCFSRFTFWTWDGKEIPAYMLSHELAHVFANLPFYGQLNDNSLLIHFDGGASVGNFSAFLYRNGSLQFIEVNWELSYLSKLFNDNALSFYILGEKPFAHLSVPGKLMGFAAFGTPSKEIAEWLRENDFFRQIWDNPQIFFDKAHKRFGISLNAFDTNNKFLQDIAATIQWIFTSETLKKLIKLQEAYNADYLYYAGGSALNIVTNTSIIESGLFKDVFIPPATNDSGLSIGAAAYLAWIKGNEIPLHSPYLNNVATDLMTDDNYPAQLIRQVAEMIMQNKVIGIARGNGEAGPRALGNRSIIARPDKPDLAKKISIALKKREWYRPIAPVMLKNLADEVTGKNIHHLAKFMLLQYKISPLYSKYLAGVIHIDATSRIQILTNRNENPFLWDLLQYLWKKYGLYGLINTSFNIKGEPIVHSSYDAVDSAKKMALDALVIKNKLKISK